MIPIQYPRLDGDGIDDILLASIVEHPPLNPQSLFAVAETGGEGSPVEVTYKGAKTVVEVATKNLITADVWPEYQAFLDATEKRQQFTVDARAIPLVGVQYVAFRTEKKRLVIHKHFNRTFVMRLQLHVVRVI